jgi:hypothetical protein
MRVPRVRSKCKCKCNDSANIVRPPNVRAQVSELVQMATSASIHPSTGLDVIGSEIPLSLIKSTRQPAWSI